MPTVVYDRILVSVRLLVYAVLAAELLVVPNFSQAIALLGAAHPIEPAFIDTRSATIGWLSLLVGHGIARTFGIGGLTFFTALTLAAALSITEWRARRVASPIFALCGAAIAVVCFAGIAHAGGGATDALCFAALLATFELPGRRAILGAALVTALWCNLSPAGILAPLFAGVFAIGTSLEHSDRVTRTQMRLVAMASVVATLPTPAFLAYPLAAARSLSVDAELRNIVFSQAPVIVEIAHQAALLVTTAVIVALAVRRTQTRSALLFSFSALCAIGRSEFIPFLGIIAAPILAEVATQALTRQPSRNAEPRAFYASCLLSALLVALTSSRLAMSNDSELASEQKSYGVLQRYSRENIGSGKLFCPHLAWCDVAERVYGLSVLADSRIANAPQAIVRAQEHIDFAKKGWDQELRDLGVGAVFLDRRSGLATLLAAEGWREYGGNGDRQLFVRARRAG